MTTMLDTIESDGSGRSDDRAGRDPLGGESGRWRKSFGLGLATVCVLMAGRAATSGHYALAAVHLVAFGIYLAYASQERWARIVVFAALPLQVMTTHLVGSGSNDPGTVWTHDLILSALWVTLLLRAYRPRGNERAAWSGEASGREPRVVRGAESGELASRACVVGAASLVVPLLGVAGVLMANHALRHLASKRESAARREQLARAGLAMSLISLFLWTIALAILWVG